MDKEQKRSYEQAINAGGLGVLKFSRQDLENGGLILTVSLRALGDGEYHAYAFCGTNRGKSIVECTTLEKNISALDRWAKHLGKKRDELTDEQAVEALARFAVDWDRVRAADRLADFERRIP